MAYPLVVHIAVINGHTVVALLILLSVPVFLFFRNMVARLLVGLAVVGTILLLSATIEDSGQFLLYLMPVLINAALATFFGQTLLPGKVPLITRLSTLLRGKLEPGVAIYTRHVTLLWAMFFAMLAMESLLLALFASIEIWSLFANILNYILAGLLFTGEYFFRIHHLDNLKHPSFSSFVQKLSQVYPPRAPNKQ